MSKIEQTELKKTDIIVQRRQKNGEVKNVIFPNGLQAGLPKNGFNSGIKIPSTSENPEDVSDRLYAVDGALYYGGIEVGTGGGGGGTPGGSDTQVQFNDGGAFAGDAGLTYDRTTDLLTIITASITSASITSASIETDLYVRRDVFVTGSIGVGTSSPKTAFSFVNDFSTTTFENQLSDGEAGGDIMKYGTGTTVAGELYYLHTDGSWSDADADLAAASGTDQLLGVALGTSPSSNGMLLKGFVKIASTLVNGTAVIGKAVYVSTTAGEYDFTRPSGSNDFVRIVGYCIDTDSSDILLYFNPDPTFVEIS